MPRLAFEQTRPRAYWVPVSVTNVYLPGSTLTDAPARKDRGPITAYSPGGKVILKTPRASLVVLPTTPVALSTVTLTWGAGVEAVTALIMSSASRSVVPSIPDGAVASIADGAVPPTSDGAVPPQPEATAARNTRPSATAHLAVRTARSPFDMTTPRSPPPD